MTRAVAVLRPEPGNAATVARMREVGLTAIALPLFVVRPLAWTVPDPSAHDAILLTSANALRQAGPQLARLTTLPALAVGKATAAAARDEGFSVALVGDTDAAGVMEQARASFARVLHLGGRDRAQLAAPPITATIAVYASEPCPIAAPDLAHLNGGIALLHSARAAARLAALVPPQRRGAIALAALSPQVATAAGDGWQTITVATSPNDEALIAAARMLD